MVRFLQVLLYMGIILIVTSILSIGIDMLIDWIFGK